MIPLSDRLRENGIVLRDYREGERSTTCPQCSADRKKKNDRCLSVKIEGDGGATWFCQHCDWKGGLSGLDGFQGDRPRRRKTYRKPQLPEKRETGDRLAEFFKARGLSTETLRESGCYLATHGFQNPETGQWDDRGCIAFPYTVAGEVTNIKYRTRDKLFAQEKGAKPTLYGIDRVEGDEIVFVEGEFDVLACLEAGIQNAVSLPNGAPQNHGEGKRYEALASHADKLDGMKRIILAGDDDEKGRIWFDELAARFGKDRCYRVTWPALNDVFIKDANDCLIHHGSDVLRECIDLAEALPIDGLIQPSQAIDRLWKLYDGDYGSPVSTGFDVMDRIFKVMPGELTVFSGIPAHGKSSFLDQIMINLADTEGWKFAVFSPEYSIEKHIARIIEKRAKQPFYEGWTERVSRDDVARHVEWMDGRISFFDIDDGPPKVDWLLDTARQATLRYGLNVLLLDPWNQIDSSRPSGQSETDFIGKSLTTIKRFGKRHDMAIWIVVHPSKMEKNNKGMRGIPSMYDLHGSAHWFNIPDNGIVIHRDFEAEETGVHVLKIREQPLCGQPGTAYFRFDKYDRTYHGLRCEIPGEKAEAKRVAAFERQEKMLGEQPGG